MRRHRPIWLVAALVTWGTLAAPRPLAAQDLGPTVEAIVGYSRLYHANGGEFDFGIMKPLGHPRMVEHRIGLVVRLAESDLATITFVQEQRHMVGAGVRYVVVMDGGASLSPFGGATVQVVHASTTNNPSLDSQHPTAVQPNPEDYIGLSTTGPTVGGEAGLWIRLSHKTRALVRGAIEYQAIYTNPSTHLVWGISAGVAMAIQ